MSAYEPKGPPKIRLHHASWTPEKQAELDAAKEAFFQGGGQTEQCSAGAEKYTPGGTMRYFPQED